MAEAKHDIANEASSRALSSEIPTQTAVADAPDEQIASVHSGATAPTMHRPTAPRRRGRTVWGVGIAALLGLVGGAGIGIAASRSDPAQSQQYKSLQAAVSSAQDQEEATKESFGAAQRAADASLVSANQDLEQRASAIAASESAVASSAAAISQAQAAVNANTISEGTWTVGSDVQPGHYRTTAPVSEGCYWEISRTGSNGSIVQNDLPTGGYPTVTLSVGQDFKTEGCGEWLKQ